MLITKQNDLNDFCASLKGADFITVDTEFLREKTYYPKLCLIQIGDADKNAAAIDPLEDGLDLAPVYELRFDKDILKVFHAGRQDLEIFFNLTGKVVRPFFDTQIAAMVCGYGDSIGYENLVRNITDNGLDKSSQFTNWSVRPLSERQLDYALGDVTHLVDVYLHLQDKLEEMDRTSWVFEEEETLADPATYENPPELAWQRVKIRSPKPQSLAVLRELAKWREEQAQRKDIPRNWIMRDDTLADMAGQMPKDTKQLKKIRNISSDMAEGKTGQRLLSLIKQALESDKSTWPKPAKRRGPPPNVAATQDILRMLLKVQCAQQGVATKLVASKEDLEILAQKDDADIPALKGWRYQVFGKDALALKNGNLAIGLKEGEITKFSVNGTTPVEE